MRPEIRSRHLPRNCPFTGFGASRPYLAGDTVLSSAAPPYCLLAARLLHWMDVAAAAAVHGLPRQGSAQSKCKPHCSCVCQYTCRLRCATGQLHYACGDQTLAAKQHSRFTDRRAPVHSLQCCQTKDLHWPGLKVYALLLSEMGRCFHCCCALGGFGLWPHQQYGLDEQWGSLGTCCSLYTAAFAAPWALLCWT